MNDTGNSYLWLGRLVLDAPAGEIDRGFSLVPDRDPLPVEILVVVSGRIGISSTMPSVASAGARTQ